MKPNVCIMLKNETVPMFTTKITDNRSLLVGPDTQAQLQTIFLRAVANGKGVDAVILDNGVFLKDTDIHLILSAQTRQFKKGPIATMGVLYQPEAGNALHIHILQLVSDGVESEDQIETGGMRSGIRPFD